VDKIGDRPAAGGTRRRWKNRFEHQYIGLALASAKNGAAELTNRALTGLAR
jgi:hypothetical protein